MVSLRDYTAPVEYGDIPPREVQTAPKIDPYFRKELVWTRTEPQSRISPKLYLVSTLQQLKQLCLLHHKNRVTGGNAPVTRDNSYLQV